jgi:hypothetical protein
MSEALSVYEAGAIERPATAVEIRAQVNLIQEVMKAVMKDGHHFGKIPGAGDKPTLFKPGAEKLFLTFRVAVTQQVEDLSTGDAVRFRVTATGQHIGTGNFLGAATGECSSDEEKYRWRRVVCPEEWDATPEDRKRTKWAKSQKGAYSVQQVRTNPADVANTILKMAAKRAEVALALRITAASDIFTQDIEDLPPELAQEGMGDDRPPLAEPARKSAAAPPPAPVVDAEPAEPPQSPEGELLANVLLEVVTSKPATKGTRYSVKIGDSWYSTFSDSIGELAKEAKAEGRHVNVWWVRKGDFLNITAMTY